MNGRISGGLLELDLIFCLQLNPLAQDDGKFCSSMEVLSRWWGALYLRDSLGQVTTSWGAYLARSGMGRWLPDLNLRIARISPEIIDKELFIHLT